MSSAGIRSSDFSGNHLIFLICTFDNDRFLPSDQDAVRRIHPVGFGNSVQQRQGAGPAEPAGQIYEKCRYLNQNRHSHGEVEPLAYTNSTSTAGLQSVIM